MPAMYGNVVNLGMRFSRLACDQVPQTGGGQNSDEMKSEPALALLATPGVTGEPEADIKVDSWESVSQQPSW